MSQRIVVCSGYFDPIHVGHIEYLQKSKLQGTKLIVIVNNDRQAQLKKGYHFMKAVERVKIVRAISCVDAAIEAFDDDRTCRKTVELLMPDVFTNGGDQTNNSIPEADVCGEIGCELVDGLGNKIQSSSWIIQNVTGQEKRIKLNPNE